MNPYGWYVNPAPTAVSKVPDPRSFHFRFIRKLMGSFQIFSVSSDTPEFLRCFMAHVYVYGSFLERLHDFAPKSDDFDIFLL